MKNNQKILSVFLLIFFIGFVARMVTSYVVYGPQSMDDYGHAVLPGIEFTEGKALEIPVWRSPLLVWTLGTITSMGKFIGLTEIFSLIRFQLIFLGLFSLLLPLYYLWIYRKNFAEDFNYHLLAFGFLSLHFIVIFASTRAFGESIAMTLSFVALLMMIRSVPHRNYVSLFFGSLILGIACLYRFQIGVFGIGFLVYLIWKKESKAIGILIISGLVAAGLQGLIDHQVGRWPLQTLYEYLYVNKDGAVEHSIQPWYNTWATVLILLFMPFSWPLIRHIKKLNETERLLAAMCAFFILMHSLIPHKEERFLIPVVPFLLLIVARLWSFAWNEAGEKWVFRPYAALVLIIGFCLVPISNSQSGEYEPMRFAESLQKPAVLWENQSLLQRSAFYRKIIMPPVEYRSAGNWPAQSQIAEELQNKDFVFVTSQQDLLNGMEQMVRGFGSNVGCSKIQKIQSPIDAVIFRMNPEMNVRRRASWLVHCWSLVQAP
jgi:hypothetical protein